MMKNLFALHDKYKELSQTNNNSKRGRNIWLVNKKTTNKQHMKVWQTLLIFKEIKIKEIVCFSITHMANILKVQ